MVKTYEILPVSGIPWRAGEIERSETMRKRSYVLILPVLLMMFWLIPDSA
jgi:hypothetical protein